MQGRDGVSPVWRNLGLEDANRGIKTWHGGKDWWSTALKTEQTRESNGSYLQAFRSREHPGFS
jgi:hypothetical protein